MTYQVNNDSSHLQPLSDDGSTDELISIAQDELTGAEQINESTSTLSLLEAITQQDDKEWRDGIVDFIFKEAERLRIEDPDSDKCKKFCELYESVKDEKNKPFVDEEFSTLIQHLGPLVSEHRITIYNARDVPEFIMGVCNFFQPPESMKNFREMEKKDIERAKNQLQSVLSFNNSK